MSFWRFIVPETSLEAFLVLDVLPEEFRMWVLWYFSVIFYFGPDFYSLFMNDRFR